MSIKVTTNYHRISPPSEVTSRLSELAVLGAIAKNLEQEKLYDDLKNAYNNLKKQWESSADEYCKKNTKKNWLGGGDIYTFFSCQDWDSAMRLNSQILMHYSKQEQVQYLNQSISKLNRG